MLSPSFILTTWRIEIFILLAVVVLKASCSNREDDSVNCQAKAVALEQNAIIKCNFNMDLNKTKHDFIVESKPLNSPDTFLPKEILSCHWRHPVILQCSLQDKIYFNYIVSDHITVVIKQVSKQFAGRYTCRTVPHDNRPVYSCNLVVHTTDTSTAGNINGTSTEQTVVGGDSTHSCPDEEYKVPLIVTASCLAVLLIAAVVVLAYFCWCSRSNRGQGMKDRRSKARGPSTSMETGDLLQVTDHAEVTELNHVTDREPSRAQAESAVTRI